MIEVKERLQTVTLSNNHGMSVEIINFGARIKSIKFPVNSKPTEMTLGYDSTEEYLNDESYIGATCGRVCNRISGGKFQLDGKQYKLPQNDGENCLHGGDNNFSFRYWQINNKTVTNSAVTLSLISENGDQGFPGTVNLFITYQLSEDNQLIIQYFANTDLATPINLTNHAYFNLGEKNCESLYLQMYSSSYLESNSDNIPTGKVLPVKNTDFDFSEPTNIGMRQNETYDKSLVEKLGYDHCFILDDSPFEKSKAVLTSLENQINLTIYTDQPAIQLYTGFYLNGQFKSYQGLCLEAQNYPDADNNKHFPGNVLRPNQVYQRKIIYKFNHI
jgi:aldose 1-epimerase